MQDGVGSITPDDMRHGLALTEATVHNMMVKAGVDPSCERIYYEQFLVIMNTDE